MSDYLEEDNSAFEEFKPHVLTHCTHIESNFKNCFSEQILQQHEYMRGQFAVTIGDKTSHHSTNSMESLMDFTRDTFLKIKFEVLFLPEMCI
jgi:hypothetical protein